MRFAIVKSAAELGERAFYEIKRVLDAKPDAVIGFATGRTPLPLYEKMAEDHRKNGTSYKRVTAINLDEYVGIEAKNKNSFARFMRDNLFSKIDIDPANTNIPNGMAEDLEAECARYAAFVKEHPADIQILGIGGNGHIAFNEPYTKYDTVTHIATLTSRTRSDNAEGFGNPALVPGYALTMGIAEILSAKTASAAGLVSMKYAESKFKRQVVAEVQRICFSAARAAAGGKRSDSDEKVAAGWQLPALLRGAEIYGKALRDIKFNAYFSALLYSAMLAMIEENNKWLKLSE